MDTDLVARAQRGDEGAYALLAGATADRFLAVARRILRDRDLAEDATHQALLAISQDLPRLNDPARFEAWSYRLLVHACYAEGRKERRWAPNLSVLPTDETMSDAGLWLPQEGVHHRMTGPHLSMRTPARASAPPAFRLVVEPAPR